MIFHTEPDEEQYVQARELFPLMKTMACTDFKQAAQIIQDKQMDWIALITFQDKLPDDWNITLLETDCPLLVCLNASLSELIVFFSFLRTMIGSAGCFSEEKEKTILHPLLQYSLSFIEEHLHENDLSIEMLANRLFVNRSYLSQLFKEQIGTGFKEYLIHKRIEKAKTLLRDGYSVTHSCYEVGYGDLTHFSRVFKKVTGFNPAHYKKLATAEMLPP
ncbi:helix-turn-helix transcriptional regulator [Brevibacillus migulae]|uniref:helix-turn-helix transcriptional regulator n=1 Tax=Brevibacillus migulae TaxID=1644114 RepID=UPI00106E7C8C|nr:AraC family transcriptional regulator [Brevibacillus migulae]